MLAKKTVKRHVVAWLQVFGSKPGKKNSVTSHYLSPISFPWLLRFPQFGDPISKQKRHSKEAGNLSFNPKKILQPKQPKHVIFLTGFIFEKPILCESPSVLPHKLANGWCHALGHLAPQLLYFFWRSILGWQEVIDVWKKRFGPGEFLPFFSQFIYTPED